MPGADRQRARHRLSLDETFAKLSGFPRSRGKCPKDKGGRCGTIKPTTPRTRVLQRSLLSGETTRNADLEKNGLLNRRLNNEGIEEFERFLKRLTSEGTNPHCSYLLTDTVVTEPLPIGKVEIDPRPLSQNETNEIRDGRGGSVTRPSPFAKRWGTRERSNRRGMPGADGRGARHPARHPSFRRKPEPRTAERPFRRAAPSFRRKPALQRTERPSRGAGQRGRAGVSTSFPTI